MRLLIDCAMLGKLKFPHYVVKDSVNFRTLSEYEKIRTRQSSSQSVSHRKRTPTLKLLHAIEQLLCREII